jgi:hypothetical protein
MKRCAPAAVVAALLCFVPTPPAFAQAEPQHGATYTVGDVVSLPCIAPGFSALTYEVPRFEPAPAPW